MLKAFQIRQTNIEITSSWSPAQALSPALFYTGQTQ